MANSSFLVSNSRERFYQVVVDFPDAAVSGTIRVHGSNSCGDGGESIKHIVVEPISVDKVFSKGVKVFPNPAKNNIFIEIQNTGIVIESIQLRNDLGQLLLSDNNINSIHSIDVSEYASGTYYLIFNINGEKYQSKVIISK